MRVLRNSPCFISEIVSKEKHTWPLNEKASKKKGRKRPEFRSGVNPTGVCWVKARASTLHYYHRWCIGEAADVNREKPAPKKKNKERKKNRVKNGWEENVRGNGRKRSNTIKENRAIWRCIGEGKDKATIKSSTTTPTATTKSCETANKIGALESSPPRNM